MAENTTRAKICGLTNLPDAELAVELGAWALGMIFYEQSPRRCSQSEAERIVAVLRRRVELCGVFVNAPLERVVGLGQELGLSLLQFNGDEGPSFCSEAARRTGARVIKAAQVSGPGDVRDLERFHVDFHLLDARAKDPAKSALRGGTGDTFDWNLVRSRHSRIPLILSGGLNAENVGAAIDAVRPYAVDNASGTESAPGRKDPRKLRAFLAAVESVSREDASAELDAASAPGATAPAATSAPDTTPAPARAVGGPA